MSYFILTHRSLSSSARALAHGISSNIGEQVYVNFGDTRPASPPVIRWANPSFMFHRDTEYNDPEKIRTVANKKKFSDLMTEYRIPVVEILSGVPERFPVVIRKTLCGMGGDGIEIVTNMEEFQPFRRFFWSYWIEFGFELGVHVFDGRILKIFKKVKDGPDTESLFPIRNFSNGYRFVRVRDESFPKLLPLVQSFYNSFDIKFGRLDIGWDSEEKQYKIIEFNSAPGISTNVDTLNSYVENFSRAIFNM